MLSQCPKCSLSKSTGPMGSVLPQCQCDWKLPTAQPQQETVTIWYMRDNHTFKKLSADVSTALIEIEQEFNEGYTYGMLCSKSKGFPCVHASGEKKRLEFFAECKKTLEEWLPNTAPPQRTWVGLTEEELNLIYAEPQTHIGQYARAIEAKLKEKNT